MNILGDLKNKNILLLQGPIGCFFTKLDTQFRKKGAKTFRIGLNAGDAFFSPKNNYTGYRDTKENWKDFISTYLKTHNINMVFLFGDCRFYQAILVEVAYALGIDIFIFEEGYIRPNYITLERFGVNNYSKVPRNRVFYDKLSTIKKIKEPLDVNYRQVKMWMAVIIYYAIANIFSFRYKYYEHHRNFSAVEEFFLGARSLIRKVIYTQRDKKYLKLIKGKLSKKYFFVPLQTHNDFQILQHSDYGSIEIFITEVLESFSKYANKELKILFKHHPIDRGRKNYTKYICEISKELKIEDRVLVVHDLHLPTCLQHARGTVTINSTVGLSSIYHAIPTLTLGNAIYDIEDLTNKDKKLKDFWNNPITPNKKLFKKFRQYLIGTTQLNGSFYGRMPNELL